MVAEVKIRVVTEDKATANIKKGNASLKQMLGTIGAVAGVTIGATAALKAMFDFGKESTLLAARVQTLGVVTETLGRNVGKSKSEIDAIENSIQDLGITTQASRQSVAQMIQSNLDLADATKIARLAQDTAVIANENSSQSFQALTTIIATGNTLMARRRGLLVDFQGAYQKLAKELGVTTSELTQQDKVLARTNEVMAQGVNIAGTYEAAMETTGKKLGSLARPIEELKLNLGELTQNVFGAAIDGAGDFVVALNEIFDAADMADKIDELGLSLQRQNEIFNKVDDGVWTLAEAYDHINELYRVFAERGADADKAMLNFASDTIVLDDSLNIISDDLEGTGNLMDFYSNRAKAAALATRFYGENLRRTERNAEEFTATVGDQIAALQQMGAMLKTNFSGMTAYDQIFGTVGAMSQQESLMGAVTDRMVGQLGTFADMAAGGSNVSDAYFRMFDALEALDPALTQNMEDSSAFSNLLNGLDSALKNNIISAETYASIVKGLGEDIGAGVTATEAMATAVGNLTAATSATGAEGVSLLEGMLPAGELAEIETSIAGIADLADDPVLTMEDKASPVLDPVLAKILEFEGDHVAILKVIRQGGGWDIDPDSIPYKAFGGSVFSGQPVMVGEKGPEIFVPPGAGSIVPNDKMGGGDINISVVNNNPLAAAIVSSTIATSVDSRLNSYMRAA